MSDVEDGELTDGDEEPDSYRDVAAKDVSPISLSDLLKASSDAVEVTSYDQEFSELRSLTRDVAVVRGKRCDQSTEHRSSTKSVDKKGASKRCDRQRRTQEYDHDSSKSQRDGRKRTRRNSSSEKRSFSVDKRNPDENWRSNQSSSNEFYDSDPNRNKSRAVCKYFLKGFCRRESECPFSHDVSALKREELCRFYLTTGGCRKRDSCLFMHEEFPCKYFHTGASCYAGGNCRFSHEPLNDFTKECLDKWLEHSSARNATEHKTEAANVSSDNRSQAVDSSERARCPDDSLEAEGLDSAEEILNVAGPGFYVSNCSQILVLEEDKPQDLDLRFIVGAPPSNSFGAFDVDMRHGVLFPADEDLRVGLPSPRRMQAVEESPWDDSAVDSDVDEKPLVIDESGEPFDYSEFFLSCSTLLFSTAASSRPKTEAIANKINVESWTSMNQYTKKLKSARTEQLKTQEKFRRTSVVNAEENTLLNHQFVENLQASRSQKDEFSEISKRHVQNTKSEKLSDHRRKRRRSRDERNVPEQNERTTLRCSPDRNYKRPRVSPPRRSRYFDADDRTKRREILENSYSDYSCSSNLIRESVQVLERCTKQREQATSVTSNSVSYESGGGKRKALLPTPNIPPKPMFFRDCSDGKRLRNCSRESRRLPVAEYGRSGD